MLSGYHYVLIVILFVSLFSSVVHSIRQRRQKDPILRGLFTARMNISMGILLLAIATIQVTVFDMNSARLVLGTVFGLLGLFNLFAGLRNRSYFASKSHNGNTPQA